MFTSLGDLVGTAGDAAIDSALDAIVSPVVAEAREVRGDALGEEYGMWPEGPRLEVTREAMALSNDKRITFGEAVRQVEVRRARPMRFGADGRGHGESR